MSRPYRTWPEVRQIAATKRAALLEQIVYGGAEAADQLRADVRAIDQFTAWFENPDISDTAIGDDSNAPRY